MIPENNLEESLVTNTQNTQEANSSFKKKLKTCDELKTALEGKLGEIVSKHEEMILHYYKDVQMQANQSFDQAKKLAYIGFGVLIVTLIYALVFDALGRFGLEKSVSDSKDYFTIGGIGIISGFVIEFIAAINFWLYTKASKQFNAFHICLERTHRYLIAYKISEQLTKNRDITLEKLICIMANAPMITSHDIDGVGIDTNKMKGVYAGAVSTEVESP
jgi:hypothetical protein